jgi:hypothetical protein
VCHLRGRAGGGDITVYTGLGAKKGPRNLWQLRCACVRPARLAFCPAGLDVVALFKMTESLSTNGLKQGPTDFSDKQSGQTGNLDSDAWCKR